ncbi:hypothetical protein TW95_gp1114 [Pandoravirus inopinatum]|uniref:Uncharacterized protein n=1 Tax=Pandoravirus inopinatum TaxID=1605721 RepID=A0A0B5IYB9_9VIRU|nr:hypothetical protein TW95_gp1114 [Pandoravirus inopinatum]AJF97848.1 hypothetical protein [Pandoravirus inopinatum]
MRRALRRLLFFFETDCRALALLPDFSLRPTLRPLFSLFSSFFHFFNLFFLFFLLCWCGRAAHDRPTDRVLAAAPVAVPRRERGTVAPRASHIGRSGGASLRGGHVVGHRRMVAYVWWALGSEGVYAMAALITTGVLANTATTSYIAPVDLSERPSVGAGRPRPVASGADAEAGLHAIEAGSSSYYDYSDDDAFYDEYAEDEPALVVAGVVAASVIPSATTTRPRPRPGRMRSAAMRTLLLNLFLHNAVLFLYDVTSVLARLEDAESAPVVRRALVLSNLASVWYRAGQALFHYRKYNFAWRNVMIPQFEAAPITAR